MNYKTTATEVQQVREESLLIQEAEELQTLSIEEMSKISGGGLGFLTPPDTLPGS